MNTKRKIMNTLVAGTLLVVSGTASATTFIQWLSNPIIDDDLDMKFTLNSYSTNLLDQTTVSINELEVGGVDFYDVGFEWHSPDFPDGWNGGGYIDFTMTSLDPDELISSVSFDTDVIGLTFATKQLFDIGASTPFLTLESINGSHDPIGGGEYYFPERSAIRIVDTYNLANNGTFVHSDNFFNVVPEPASLSLFGIGFLAALAARRRINKA